MAAMGYGSAVKYIKKLERKGTQLGLGRMERAAALLGNPQLSFRCVHVAGTNGKGSVCAMVESVLRAAGFKTGLYTSPHMVDFRERTCIAGKKISEGEFAAAVKRVEEIDRKHKIGLTQFEALACAAFLNFADAGVEIAVVETGMGGRIDATNIVKPEVAAITNIELEHTKYLGSTIAKIAKEKAGIIKRGCNAVASQMRAEALRVVEHRCAETGCKLAVVGKDIGIAEKGSSLAGTRFDAELDGKRIKGLKIRLLGKHQLPNAACALGIIEALRRRGFKIHEKAVRRGLANAKWKGRFEVHKGKPVVVLDAAHNPAGMKTLADALLSYFPLKEVIFVIGVSKDKDIGGIAAEVARASKIAFATESSYRAMRAAKVAKALTRRGIECRIVMNPKSALAEAKKRAGKIAGRKGLVCVAGSIFLLSDLGGRLH